MIAEEVYLNFTNKNDSLKYSLKGGKIFEYIKNSNLKIFLYAVCESVNTEYEHIQSLEESVGVFKTFTNIDDCMKESDNITEDNVFVCVILCKKSITYR